MKALKRSIADDWNWKETLQLIGMVLFVVTLPFHRLSNEIATAFLLVSCVPGCSIELLRRRWKTILIFSSIYLLALVSSLYAPSTKLALHDLGIESTLLLMPVMMGLSYEPTQLKNDIVKIFYIAAVSVALLYLGWQFIDRVKGEQINSATLLSEDQLNHQYSYPVGIHATFFSAYVSLSLYFLLSYLLRYRSMLLRMLIILLMCLSIFSLLMLSSRTILLITFSSILVLLLIQLGKGRWTIAFFVSAIIVLPLVFFWKESIYFKKRFESDLQKDIKWREVQALLRNPVDMGRDSILKNDGSRIERWIAAMQVIKENPVIGHGTGQEKPALFKKYKQLGLSVTLEKGYDSHNQFLAYTIRSGIPGLIVFLGMIIYGLVIAIRSRNYEYLLFLVLIICVSLTENFLSSNKGIEFFAFFNSFLFLGQRGNGVRRML
jgi:O-antigen ligase